MFHVKQFSKLVCSLQTNNKRGVGELTNEGKQLFVYDINKQQKASKLVCLLLQVRLLSLNLASPKPSVASRLAVC